LAFDLITYTYLSVIAIPAAYCRPQLRSSWPTTGPETSASSRTAWREPWLARFDQLTVDDLPEKIRKHTVDPFAIVAIDAMEIVPIDEVERRYIISLVGGSRSRAAEILGIDRRTLYRRLEKYESAAERKAGE